MIKNGRDTLLNQGGSTLPNVACAMDGWFQPMKFIKVDKDAINHRLEEEISEISFRGVWQPLKGQALAVKPEGQRSWKWFRVHSDIDLELKIDEIIEYRGTRYRIMETSNYSEYGYFEYHIVEDYRDA